MQLDGLTIRRLSGGRVWIDGGTMFGVVPKVLWERKCPPDGRNRILVDCNCLLVQTPERLVLIDTGYGSNPSPRKREHESLEEGHPLLRELAALGVAPEQIDGVILTHLHYDHAGGCTRRDADGTLRPVFPRARHIVQAAEWQDATANMPELKGNYPAENFLPLWEAGLVDLIHGDGAIPGMAGISVRVTGGHTRGHQAVYLGAGDDKAVCPGDLCPTAAHLPAFWALAYDQFLLDTRRAKPRVLGEAADRGWPVLFAHDAYIAGARLRRSEREDFVVGEILTV